jgi:hypothetical protein
MQFPAYIDIGRDPDEIWPDWQEDPPIWSIRDVHPRLRRFYRRKPGFRLIPKFAGLKEAHYAIQSDLAARPTRAKR